MIYLKKNIGFVLKGRIDTRIGRQIPMFAHCDSSGIRLEQKGSAGEGDTIHTEKHTLNQQAKFVEAFLACYPQQVFSTSFGFSPIDFSGDFLGRQEDDEVHRGPHHFLVGGVMLCPPPHLDEVSWVVKHSSIMYCTMLCCQLRNTKNKYLYK